MYFRSHYDRHTRNPLVKAAIHEALGETYEGLDEYKKAEAHLEILSNVVDDFFWGSTW